MYLELRADCSFLLSTFFLCTRESCALGLVSTQRHVLKQVIDEVRPEQHICYTMMAMPLPVHLPTLFEHFQHVITKCVSVLLQQANDIVEHLPSIMTDTKLGMVHFRLDVEPILLHTKMTRHRKCTHKNN